jgi:glycosyltransferase involved in cell wall biosynthesis
MNHLFDSELHRNHRPDPELTRAGPALVTLIISPRERFSVARESLLSIIGNSSIAYDLIYVDAGGTVELSDWLDKQAELRGFRILRPGYAINPNEARNAGLRLAKTRYVAFLDNDVICAPGWLEALVKCAEEEQADMVAPLICHGLPVHTSIHHAGGRLVGDGQSFFAQAAGERVAVDQIALAGKKITDVASLLKRGPTDSFEFHCVLTRRSLFERIGPFDEGLLSTREHNDLGLALAKAKAKIVFEPAATVTYLFPSRQRPMLKGDWNYFMLHWSPQWQQRSIRHYEAKWGLKLDARMASRAWLNWRLHEGVVKTLVRRIPGTQRFALLRRVADTLVGRSVRAWASFLVARDDFARRHRNAVPSIGQPVATSPSTLSPGTTGSSAQQQNLGLTEAA